MPLPPPRERRRIGRTNKSSSIVNDFRRGQNTKYEDSKIKVDELAIAENVIFEKKNIKVRRGVADLGTVTDILNASIWERKAGNDLMSFNINGSNTELKEVDRSTGTAGSVLQTITGTTEVDATSMSEYLYYCNGNAANDIQVRKADDTNTTIALTTGKPQYIASGEETLWVIDTDGLLHFSQKQAGQILGFSIDGTQKTGGIASTNLASPLGVKTSGLYAIVFGKSGFEIHARPTFQGGETTFSTAPNTLVAEFKGQGVLNRKSFIVVDGYLYFANKSGLYKYLIGSDSPPVHIDTNKERHRAFEYDDCAMGYHAELETLYISCRSSGSSVNDKVIAVNLMSHEDYTLDQFSVFNKLHIREFAIDSDNLYFVQEYDDKIVDAFQSTYKTDNGNAIDGELLGMNNEHNTLLSEKKAGKMFLDAQSDGADSIFYKFYVDRKDTSVKIASFTFEATLVGNPNTLGGSMGAFGNTPYGLSGYVQGGNELEEKVWQNSRIGRRYARGAVGITFSTINSLSIRSFGWYWAHTKSQVNNRTFQ